MGSYTSSRIDDELYSVQRPGCTSCPDKATASRSQSTHASSACAPHLVGIFMIAQEFRNCVNVVGWQSHGHFWMVVLCYVLSLSSQATLGHHHVAWKETPQTDNNVLLCKTFCHISLAVHFKI